MPEVIQELQEIRTLAREFALAELRPNVERWDHDGAFGAELVGQVAELGFFGMTIPESHGGMGFDLATYAAALEEIAWGEPAIALMLAQNAIAAQLIQQHGSAELQQDWLESISTGTALPCIALAEEQAGSDLTEARTRATQQGSDWLIKGAKAWVTNVSTARLALVLAATETEEFGLFAVRTDAGVTPGARASTLGLRPLEIGAATIDARVPGSALLLGPLPLAELMSAWQDIARVSIAAISVGISQAALDHAVGYADEREQFGRKLREFEGLQYKMADMVTRTQAARALLERATRDADGALLAMAKVFASETAMWVTTQAVQIFGGYGYMRDYPVEKLMRDAKAMELMEGSNELLRIVIAQSLYE